MAAGLPEVVTNVSGSQDMVTTGRNGIVVEPGEVDVMAGALLQLLSSAEMRDRYGKANSNCAADYDWSIISRRYLECV